MKKGWETKIFDDCIEKVTYTQKVQRKDFLDDGDFPIVSQEEAFINGYWNDDDDLYRVSTPVVVFGDHTKVLKYVDFDFVLGADGVKILQPRQFLFPKFFYYRLTAENFESLGYARHYKLLKGMEIPVPPLPEQKRIVAILDQAFEAIATAKANAEKNLQNARALFDSHLQSVFSQCGEFPSVRIGDIAEVFDGPHATPKTVESGPLFLGISALQDGKINLGETRHVTPQDFKQWTRRVKPVADDVVFSYETRLGQAAIIPEGLECCLGRRMGLVRLNRDRVPLPVAKKLWAFSQKRPETRTRLGNGCGNCQGDQRTPKAITFGIDRLAAFLIALGKRFPPCPPTQRYS